MAVTLGKSPVIMTAAGDAITGNWKVTTIRCVTTTTSGAFILLDVAGGRKIAQSASLNANDAEDLGNIGGTAGWIDGLYVSQIPDGGEVHVYYE